jgi:hypothetical protein
MIIEIGEVSFYLPNVIKKSHYFTSASFSFLGKTMRRK